MDAMPEVQLSAGTIRYRDSGDGPAVVFVHGLLVNGTLWDEVVPRLQGRVRCLVPDWPLGSHRPAMKSDADLSPRGIARLIAEFVETLRLERPTLVANDTGGAITQLLLAERPEVAGRVLLTNCDCFENFLPPMFRPLQLMAKAGLLRAVAEPMRLPAVRRLPMAYGALTNRRITRELSDPWVEPALSDRNVRRDVAKTLRAVDSNDTLDAAARLRGFDGPAVLAWGTRDRFFGVDYGRRLAACFRDATLVEVDGARAFVPLDAPDRVAELLLELTDVAERPPAKAGGRV